MTDFDFSDWLKEHGHGDTNKVLTTKLKELLVACESVKGKGTINLTIEVGADRGMAEVSTKIKVTTPMPSLHSGSYFVTVDGELRTEDPKQTELPLKSLNTLSFKDRS